MIKALVNPTTVLRLGRKQAPRVGEAARPVAPVANSRPKKTAPPGRPRNDLDGGFLVDGALESSSDTTLDSFDHIVARYYSKVYNICYRYMLNSEEAEDLTQDTFVRAHQSFSNFRGESAVFTWLYRIAINLCHNRTKQLKRRKRMEQESLDEPVGDEGEEQQREVADLTMSPQRVAESKELQVYLQRCIRSLPQDYKDVIILREFQGLSYEEIAETLGCSLEAVKSRLFRARGCLKERLSPYLYGEEYSVSVQESSLLESQPPRDLYASGAPQENEKIVKSGKSMQTRTGGARLLR